MLLTNVTPINLIKFFKKELLEREIHMYKNRYSPIYLEAFGKKEEKKVWPKDGLDMIYSFQN